MSDHDQGEACGLPLPTYVGYLMYQTEQHRRALAADCIAQHGLNFSKWVALASLSRFGECSMTRLAKLSAADRTTLTRSIDGLIREGLVERGAQASDRRKVVVRLTTAGEELLDRVREDIHPIHQEVCAELTEEEQANLATYLQKILSGLITEPEWKHEVLSYGPAPYGGAWGRG
ncbi:MarR family winged helix-turn-helix transcriptional regulator [Caulobacter sp. DWR2-3-1b2]|uniref:MarR family winged helix-turn-helix transcriptional regulator n=1 Tax=unclassified Caulobacter TaxID=2648921 RepID=UPI003CE8ECDC